MVALPTLALLGCGSESNPMTDFRAAGREEVLEAAQSCQVSDPEHYFVGEEDNGLRVKSGELTEDQRECLKNWQARRKARFEI